MSVYVPSLSPNFFIILIYLPSDNNCEWFHGQLQYIYENVTKRRFGVAINNRKQTMPIFNEITIIYITHKRFILIFFLFLELNLIFFDRYSTVFCFHEHYSISPGYWSKDQLFNEHHKYTCRENQFNGGGVI